MLPTEFCLKHKPSGGSHCKVFLHQLEAHVRSGQYISEEYNLKELWVLIKQYNQYLLEKGELKEDPERQKIYDHLAKKGFRDLYKGKNIIIGGGAEFVQDFTDEKGEEYLNNILNEEIVVGCNQWALYYPATWNISGNPAGNMNAVENIMYSKKCFTAVNTHDEVPPHVSFLADKLFEGLFSKNITKEDNGKLILKTCGVTAVHAACLMGAKNILLFGVGFVGKNNSQWDTDPVKILNYSEYIKDDRMDEINEIFQKFEDFYKVKIYQADKNARTNLPYKSLENFIKLGKSRGQRNLSGQKNNSSRGVRSTSET